ncbi:G-patch domain-containingprotein [Purpureocillium lavendulum]|uniref:G-patch domain-containingprotein n=1 Tax=Purpureocillium lavendulum TaxID=1247861 RepID=A0AB34G5L3_9HYPO|nr:G-patch domain-containingprotein [Purpureocillium lavendulum]
MYDDNGDGRGDDDEDIDDRGRRRSRGRYHDGDYSRRDDYHNRRDDTSRGRYVRSRSHSRVRAAGRPTDTLKLEGLPPGISSAALREGLLESSVAADYPPVDVRVVTSKGYCRAFVQFHAVDDAVVFVKEHFPSLLVTLPHSTDEVPDGKVELHLHFARSQGDLEQGSGPPPPVAGGDWVCQQCSFRNFASRRQCRECGFVLPGVSLWEGRTGAADVARSVDKNMQFLVVFPLPPQFDEEKLANEMKRLELVKVEKPKGEAPKLKSTAPSVDGAGFGARPGSLHRVFLMRDIATRTNLRYGFAEFWTPADTAAALKKFHMTRSFEIAGNVVTIAMIHMGVFVPEERAQTLETDFISFRPLFNPDVRIRYRDFDLYASAQLVAEKSPDEGTSKAVVEEKADASKAKKRKAPESGLVESAPKKSTHAMTPQMQFWQDRHNEIRGVRPENGAAQGAAEGLARAAPFKFSMSSTKASGTIKPQPLPAEDQVSSDPAPAQEQEVSYVDRDRLVCLICMMRYKSVDEVNVHEKSGNHKRAIEDEAKVKAALPRIAARDKRLQQQEGTQYRDRAKERREAFSQPDKPSTKTNNKSKDTAAQSVKEEVKKPVESKGAGMLAKMGWSKGEGLGATGDGLTEALTASAYKEGVGLGAEGGKLGDAQEVAEGRTKDSYASYVSAAQDRARERYKQME